MSIESNHKTYAHEVFMDQARKEGRVRNEELSMKVLKPDLSLQARVNHIDTDHVRALHEILKGGQPLAPIIVFELPYGDFKIADGFHRHEVYRREQLLGIPCIVIKGTMQEAIEYAASCNQNLCLGRSRDDAKKAVLMLLENGWLNRSYQWISRQSGVSAITVKKYVLEYHGKHGTVESLNKECEDGQFISMPQKISTGVGDLIVRGNGLITGMVNGRLKSLGYSLVEAKNTLKRINKSISSQDLLLTNSNISKSLGKHGIPWEELKIDGVRLDATGYCGDIAATALSMRFPYSDRLPNGIIDAIGRATFCAETFFASRQVILMPVLINEKNSVMKTAARLGIEFMNLDQFVESAKMYYENKTVLVEHEATETMK